MLVVDVKERATLAEIVNHPWMTKGFNGPPESFLPHREPVQLPLDPVVINKMQGFDFGTAAHIQEQMTRIIDSDEYQTALRRVMREDPTSSVMNGDRKKSMFDFYKRRNSISREGLTAPSTEAIRGHDPLNAYSPLLSIYYLAREKIERERHESNPGALTLGTTADAPPLKMPDLPTPKQAHTNSFTPEMPGESLTGGRSRARARTNGEDELASVMKHLDVNGRPPHQAIAPSLTPSTNNEPPRKEGTAMGLLRRFSTRRAKDRDVDRPQPPSFSIQTSQDTANATTPKKSFSVRRSRRRGASPPSTMHNGGSQGQHEGLLNPPTSKRSGLLNRSTSVNSADFRARRFDGREPSENTGSPTMRAEPPVTSESDRSDLNVNKLIEHKDAVERSNAPPAVTSTPRTPGTARTKSLGHARQESIQARRQKREEGRSHRRDFVPEETDAELRGEKMPQRLSTMQDAPGLDISRPGGLKGLFSSSTTSSKSVQFIRNDLIRVLKQLGVEYQEVRGGFACRHAPSINLDDIRDPVEDEKSGRVVSGHQRRISFVGFRNRDRDDGREEKLIRTVSRRRQPDQSFVTNSEGSDEYVHGTGRGPTSSDQARDMDATTTRVQDDTGERMVLRFEVAIVKIPLFSLHGIQFKKIQGSMNQYRSMTSAMLNSLRL